MRSLYGTKVNLVKAKEKGKIIFEVYTKEELDRIIEMLLNIDK